jgi:6-pyruvoyltetrahydropterin/6-carboxytetrahydropterin synthase
VVFYDVHPTLNTLHVIKLAQSLRRLEMAKYLSTKTYGNDRGLSCCFRQWRSTHSHCALLHGYSIGIKLIFESETLDDRNWVMDFGGLKAFKEWSEHMFDHTLVVAEDDPHLEMFLEMAELGLQDQGGVCDIRVVPGVGCEKFAELAYHNMNSILHNFQKGQPWQFTKNNKDLISFTPRYPVGRGVRLRSVEVFEHAGNSAVYEG